jgi:hypothetical protein
MIPKDFFMINFYDKVVILDFLKINKVIQVENTSRSHHPFE